MCVLYVKVCSEVKLVLVSSNEIEGDKAFVSLDSVKRRRQTDYIMLASRSLWSDTVLCKPAGKHLLSASAGLYQIFTTDTRTEFYFLACV